MKKQTQKVQLLLIALLLSTQLVSAQKADTSMTNQSSSMYDRYLQRHKTFNTIGWLLMVPGAVTTTAGIVTVANNPHYLFFGPLPEGYNKNAGSGAILVGGSMMLASIPFFIIASENKRKAYVQLKSGNVPGLSGFNYAGINLKINL